MNDPRGFLKYPRKTVKYRLIEERIHDWKDVYLPQAPSTPQTIEVIKEQATRCMDCGVPFCQSTYSGCPVSNLIPDWNDLVHEGRWQEALKSLHSTNNFPEFTGKLCPAPCESACVLGVNSDPVSIRNIESAIIEFGFKKGWVKPILPKVKTGKKVAIVGSGPAGLAAAQQLARAGHSVTVFEKADKPGGLLRYGIPEFKLEKSILDRRLEQMQAEGIEFINSVNVADNITELLGKYDSVCLAMGAEKPRDLLIPGRDLLGVHFAMDYLTHQNKNLKNPEFNAKGKQVVILGGGDTGSDCLGTAHRQGCASATQIELMGQPPLQRSEKTPWPLWPVMLRTSHAHEEGGKREFGVSTLEFLGDAGRVRAIKAQHQNGGSVTPFEIKADLVLLAMGFTGPQEGGLIDKLKLKRDSRGCVFTDSAYRTSEPRVYAAGDVRRGASLIVWAIAEGRKMAQAVNQDLKS